MHESYEQLTERIEAAKDLVVVGGLYRHYKDPESRYRVRDLLIIEADERVGVVYTSEQHPDIKWLRPLDNWLEVVDDQHRFELIK